MHGYVPYCYTCQRRFPNTHLLKCHLRSNEHVTNAQNYCALHSQGTNPDKRQPKMANLTDGQSNSLKGNSKQPKADRLHGKKGESVGVAKGTVLPMNTSEAATDQVRQSKSFKGNWKQRKAASLHGKKRISVGVTKGTASCVSLSEAANDQVRQSKSLKGNWKQRKAASLRGKKRRSIGVTKSAAPRVSLSEAANDQVGQSKNLKDNSKQPKMAPLHFIKSGGIKTIPRVGSSEAANDQDRKSPYAERYSGNDVQKVMPVSEGAVQIEANVLCQQALTFTDSGNESFLVPSVEITESSEGIRARQQYEASHMFSPQSEETEELMETDDDNFMEDLMK
ncbi:hypothetical protein D918_02072 [Trichuris suis]|nr:hypothetical protein D918_02072 [Trichuris suis]